MRKNRSGGQSRGSPVTHIASHSGKIGQVGALVQSLCQQIYYGSVSIKCTVFSCSVCECSGYYKVGGNQYYFINGMS